MRNGRFLGGLVAALALMALLAGCGTAHPGGPSALDPAKMAPANSLIYASMTVRPQGSLAQQMHQTLTKLMGSNADRTILNAVNKGLSKDGMSYRANIKPWLGQRIGVVITQLPTSGMASTGVGLIMPTRNPSAAAAFLRREVKKNPGTQGKVSRGYALYGGAMAYQDMLKVTPGNSLATQPGYRTTTAQLGSGTAGTLYMNLHSFAQYAAASPTSSASGLGSLLKQSMSRIGPHAAVAAGLRLKPSAISFDVVETGVRQTTKPGSANIGNLPAGSWLALTTGAFGGNVQKRLQLGFRIGLMTALSRANASGANPLTGALTQRLGFIEHDVLPALGPMSLAVGGTSPLNLTIGLSLKPASMKAATRLLGMLRGLAARSSALSVSGTDSHFSVKVPTGSRLLVNEIHRAVVAIYGFANPAAFLSPARKLSQDPAYQQALAQLPSGSSVPIYLAFPPIASIVQLTDHQPSAAKTLRVLHKLSYLIVGGTPGHSRMVLGLR